VLSFHNKRGGNRELSRAGTVIGAILCRGPCPFRGYRMPGVSFHIRCAGPTHKSRPYTTLGAREWSQ